MINERSSHRLVQSADTQEVEMTQQRARIAQLESQLIAQREAEIINLRELASTRSYTPSSEAATVRMHFPLPKLDLPIFSGAYEEWLGFRDTFKAIIHDDPSIPKVQKLRFLRSYLRDNAARVIENIGTSDASYDIAWNLLVERFNNKRIIIQNHVQALFDLQILNKESAVCLRNLLDTTLRHLRALKVLDQPTEYWDTLLIYLIISKLDKESRKEWERSVRGSEMPKFNELIEFLRERCQVLEALNPISSDQNKQNIKSVNRSQSYGEKKNLGKSFINTQSNLICYNCKGNHIIQNCEEFIKSNISERTQIVKKKGLCFNCLKRNHLISDCKSGNCSICNRRHNTLLHVESKPISDQNKDQNNLNQIKSMHIVDSSKVMLSTAIINMLDSSGGQHACRVLLDSGSQPNLITEDFAKRLKLNKKKLDATIEVVNNKEINSAEWVIAAFQSKDQKYSAKLTFLVLPQITGQIPAIPMKKEFLKIPKNINLSDPDFDKPGKIDALIGAELFYDLLYMNKISLALPRTSLQSTKVGWIVTGKVSNALYHHKFSCNLIRDPLNVQLEKFWKLEELAERRYLSAEEEACERHFLMNVQRNAMGRYRVRLPFNEKQETLGSSYEIARQRFFTLERKLERNPELKNQYHEFMRTYKNLKHMESIPTIKNHGYYIPHHSVIKDSSLTTKLRVVFDASAKSESGVSLNDSLMVGPTIQDGIFELVLRFRSHLFVLSADVEKMYRQFEIHPDDRKYQNILWRFNKTDPLQSFQLNTVTYGTATAPFLATRCLQQLAEDEGGSFPKAASVLKNDFYVDDLLTGTDTLEEARQLRDDLIQLTNKAKLRLCKWISNEPELIKDLPDRLDDLRQKLCDDQITRTLGVSWNAVEDTLNFDVNIKPQKDKDSKRTILSQIAQLYDPLGLISPVIVFAKIEMQKLWKLNLGWDDPIPTESSAAWHTFQDQLSLINDWNLPRAVKVPNLKEYQLHGYSDASQKAYGARIYIRSSNENGHYSTLLCSKSRIAPVKIVSLPRLELCAAVLLAKLFKAVQESLKVSFDRTVFWTDSTIVLNWINTPPYKLQTFEANRITEIQKITNAPDWRHVPSKENPADFISRGQLPEEFLNNYMWKNGPAWLNQSEINWPDHPLEYGEEDIPKRRGVPVLTSVVVSKWNLWNKYSSWTKLVNVVAYCLRFVHNTRKQMRLVDGLSVMEIRSASKRIVQIVQREEFSEEIHKSSIGEGVPKTSKILKLNPIMEDGLLRVGGRMKNADLSYGLKHPILLPKTHPVTTLLIRKTHLEIMHAGINATLYALRQKYWIVDGRVAVGRILHACIKCCRAKPREVSYVMGDLPKVRVTATRPFENCGIDYCGHFYIKEKRYRNKNKIKVYAAIFICLATKAVHIELVGDLTTEAFLGSLRRFFARRGKAKALYSDNATNFIGANNELRELHKLIVSDEHNKKIQKSLQDQEIEWHFIPPRTPHFGGVWEAAVKSLKHHMRRTIGETLFTYEELATYMCEIEGVLNSRPLTPMSSDPSDFQPLTPGHFLIGQSLLSVPTFDYSSVPINRLSSWQHMQKIKLDLWKRWTKEYLNELNVRKKWFTGNPEIIKIGTLVVLRDDNLPPLRWSLGRILEVFPGKDGIIRVVKVKTENGIFERGIKKISPLPVEI